MEPIANRANSALNFTVQRWSAWLPASADKPELEPFQSNKLLWAKGENLALSHQTPDVSFIPAMQRRRLTTLAKTALSVAWNCWENGEQIPTVFCSVHGETSRCFNILQTIAKQGDVSPTDFSLSVHSGIAGLFSIATNNTAAYSVISPGKHAYSIALLEAAGLLADHHSEVLVVLYDQAIPSVYRKIAASPSRTSALALRLSKPRNQPAAVGLQLSHLLNRDKQTESGLELENLIQAFCTGRENQLITSSGWQWRIKACLSELN